MNQMLAYLNGRMIPASQACLPVYDAGVVQGASVAEQCRTFNLRPFRMDEHLDRLFRSLRHLGIDIGQTKDQLIDISAQLVTHNGGLLETGEEFGIIQFVTPGPYATYAGMSDMPAHRGPTVCVHTFRLPFELWAEKMQTGVRLVTPAVRHVPPECVSPRMKHRSRLHFFLAEQEARPRPRGLGAFARLAGQCD